MVNTEDNNVYRLMVHYSLDNYSVESLPADIYVGVGHGGHDWDESPINSPDDIWQASFLRKTDFGVQQPATGGKAGIHVV